MFYSTVFFHFAEQINDDDDDNCNRTFLIFSIFSFLNLNILHTKIEDLFFEKKALKATHYGYILADFSFFYKQVRQ